MTVLNTLKGPRLRIALTALCLLSGVAATWADELLRRIPAEAPLTLIVRNPGRSFERLNGLIARLGLQSDGGQRGYLDGPLGLFGLSSADVRLDQPIAFVFLNAEFDRPAVAMFRPTDASRWCAPPTTQPAAGLTIKRIDHPGGDFYAAQVGDLVLLGRSRRDVRSLARLPRQSLADGLDAQEQPLLQRSDVAIRVWVPAWRAKLTGLLVGLKAALALTRDGSSSDMQKRLEGASVDWVMDGAAALIRDARSTLLSIEAGPDAVRFSHYHSFDPASELGQYLSRTRQDIEDPWVGLPARTFAIAFAMNWRNPGDGGLMRSLLDRAGWPYADRSAEAATSQETDTIKSRICGFYDSIAGSSLITDISSEGRLETFGAFEVENAKALIERMVSVSRECAEILDEMSPCFGVPSEFRRAEHSGIELWEASLASVPTARRNEVVANVESLFGPGAVSRMVMAGESRVLTGVSASADAAEALCRESRSRSSERFASDPAVARLLKELPPRPHVVFLANVHRASRLAPFAMAVSSHAQAVAVAGGGAKAVAPVPPLPPCEPMKGGDPLALYGATMGPTWVRGTAYISGEDLAKSVPLLVELGREMRAISGENTPPGRSKITIRAKSSQETTPP